MTKRKQRIPSFSSEGRRDAPAKPRLHEAPLALASNGTMLVNVNQFDTVTDFSVALSRLQRVRGRIFIGVTLTPREAARALAHVGDGVWEGASYVVGARLAAERRRSKART